jgi:flavin reductase (DIM6/NTAB) family NADH-FMN oxidoreductase RutF
MMRRAASTVFIISTRSAEHRCGMTATAVAPVSMDPPAVLFCVNRKSSLIEHLRCGQRVCVTQLTPSQRALSQVFAGDQKGEKRFEIGEWCEDSDATPYLRDASANVFCEIAQMHPFATHAVTIAMVRAARLTADTNPLVYQNGGYIDLRANLSAPHAL